LVRNSPHFQAQGEKKMDASPNYKVFVFDEDGLPQFIAAIDKESACKEYAELFSPPADCRELKDEELDRMKVAEMDEDDTPTGGSITMREHLVETSVGETDAAFYLCGEE
jgi:hypothetical protein